MSRLTKEQVQKLLEQSQSFPCVSGMPTKKFFVLEDDIHSAEGFSYLNKQADSFGEALIEATHASDWTYEIYLTASLRLVAYGTVFHEAHQ